MHEVWHIGDVKITRVVEMEVAGGTRFILPDATRDACLPYRWMQPHFMDDQGNLIMSIHALVIEAGEQTIVVDTCIGNDKIRAIPTWTNLQTSFLADLVEAGYPPESVDTVMCTHLHTDHVGWNTQLLDGEWIPTFPKAQYLIAKAEWEYWNEESRLSGDSQVLDDSVRPIIDAGLAKFVDVDYELTAGIRLRPTPGHTPGHVSVSIESGSASALITGDCIHHPVQMTRVDWCSSADTDSAQGLATRRELLKELCGSQTLVIGTHFATPTAGFIRERSDGGYWLDVAAAG